MFKWFKKRFKSKTKKQKGPVGNFFAGFMYGVRERRRLENFKFPMWLKIGILTHGILLYIIVVQWLELHPEGISYFVK